MAAKKESKPLDLDDLLSDEDTLLGSEEQSKDAVEEKPTAEEAPQETEEQKRIRELEAELNQPSSAPKNERPKPESELTPDQRRIRELEDLLAKKKAKEIETSEAVYEDSGEGETILLHFLEDGFIACGQVWYRGQELEFVVGSTAHKQQIDSKGRSWLDLVDDIDGQLDRFDGRHMFAPGPWRGRKWGDTSNLKDEEEITDARRAADAERRRSRRAPIIHV